VQTKSRAEVLLIGYLLALYSLSDVYLEAGADERARSTLERIIELDPDTTVSAHRKLRDLLVRQAEWERATTIQQKLLAMITSAEERELEQVIAKGIRLGLGVALSKKELPNEAAEIFHSLISEDERFVPGYIRLGEAYAFMDAEPSSTVTLPDAASRRQSFAISP
jgi:tetratricopeptide (TPR) repeat protein